jgi:hypothetical protein
LCGTLATLCLPSLQTDEGKKISATAFHATPLTLLFSQVIVATIQYNLIGMMLAMMSQVSLIRIIASDMTQVHDAPC